MDTKSCKDISTNYYSGLYKKDIEEQCKEIKLSRKQYKNQPYLTRKKRDFYTYEPSIHVVDFKKKYRIDLGNLKKIEQITGVPEKASKEVLHRGRRAYFSSGSRPNQTPESWARARLASFILKRKAYIIDKDIWIKYNIDSKLLSNYDGTSSKRLQTIHRNLNKIPDESLIDNWETIRVKLLQAGGLKNVFETQHILNDFNHCDITPMKKKTFEHINQNKVKGIDKVNYLGDLIRKCSINYGLFSDKDGTWGTCMIGCNQLPPQDVAHLQFNSKIAFKLIWLPPEYNNFIIVDDDGNLLKKGQNLNKDIPNKSERKLNFQTADSPNSKYTKLFRNHSLLQY